MIGSCNRIDWSVWPDLDPANIPNERIEEWNNYWASQLCFTFSRYRAKLEPIWQQLDNDPVPIYREYFEEMKITLDYAPNSAQVKKLAQKYPSQDSNRKMLEELQFFQKRILEEYGFDLVMDLTS